MKSFGLVRSFVVEGMLREFVAEGYRQKICKRCWDNLF